MNIKVNDIKRPTGINRARVSVSWGQLDNGVDQITLFLSAENAFEIATVVASLRLSPSEALSVAARLVAEAEKALVK